MQYPSFKYLYPPRPEFKIPAKDLDYYDNGEYIAQPKYNGSASMLFTNGSELLIYNRHKELLNKPSPDIEFRKLAKTDKWFVYCGEYLNKGKLGEMGVKEKDKFVIWDLLVWDGLYLVGQTLEQRLAFLEQIYPCERSRIGIDHIEIYDHLCCTEFKGIYKTPTYLNDFAGLYQDIIKTDLYEGLVLKKKGSKLTYGFQESNNRDWQIKCRKETKIYKF